MGAVGHSSKTSIQLPSMDSDPPFEEAYKTLFDNHCFAMKGKELHDDDDVVTERELPLIDLKPLMADKGSVTDEEREECERAMARASSEWGFFQVVNHGISKEVLEDMRKEQEKLFREPFYKKQEITSSNISIMSPGSYRWGTPTATCLRQLSWSEAFHIPLTDPPSIPALHALSHLSSAMKQFAANVSELAQRLAKILVERLGHESTYLEEICLPSTCYLRMNRYPPCPRYFQVFGLMPHTDSDFLTILYQDQVGGLQLVKDGKWIAVKPNPEALIVNIGDLFQAWSNGVYKSVEHRVVANGKRERFSTAYFLCPSYDAVIQSCKEPSLYRKFSFREYRQQVQDDVIKFGHKVGLSRFLVCST
ncbi:Gibberellin 2-beta-dioxygenase 8 [Ancistrocladus abbreviatus]